MAKTVSAHPDKLGNDIVAGSCVAFPSYNTLMIGIVDKLTPKMVQITEVNNIRYKYTIKKYPHDIVVLNNADITMYLLKNQG